jgi:hypothetical protein
MSDVTTSEPLETRAGFAPEAGVGVSLAVGSFGFSVLMLGLADARVFTPNAIGIFVPVAFGIGAFGLLIGGLSSSGPTTCSAARSLCSTPASCSRPG